MEPVKSRPANPRVAEIVFYKVMRFCEKPSDLVRNRQISEISQVTYSYYNIWIKCITKSEFLI
jgi:hypothetical protein